MLTEAEKNWLKERSGTLVYHKFCLHCTYVKRRWFDGQTPCMLADIGRICPVFYQEDIQDAAEFEARVAMYLAKSPCLTCPSTIYGNCETRKTAKGREVIEACRLKHARLAVEQEMEK